MPESLMKPARITAATMLRVTLRRKESRTCGTGIPRDRRQKSAEQHEGPGTGYSAIGIRTSAGDHAPKRKAIDVKTVLVRDENPGERDAENRTGKTLGAKPAHQKDYLARFAAHHYFAVERPAPASTQTAVHPLPARDRSKTPRENCRMNVVVGTRIRAAEIRSTAPEAEDDAGQAPPTPRAATHS